MAKYLIYHVGSYEKKSSLPQVGLSQFLGSPTLFCPNGLNDGLQNFLIGQWTYIVYFQFLHFFYKN